MDSVVVYLLDSSVPSMDIFLFLATIYPAQAHPTSQTVSIFYEKGERLDFAGFLNHSISLNQSKK